MSYNGYPSIMIDIIGINQTHLRSTTLAKFDSLLKYYKTLTSA